MICFIDSNVSMQYACCNLHSAECYCLVGGPIMCSVLLFRCARTSLFRFENAKVSPSSCQGDRIFFMVCDGGKLLSSFVNNEDML